MAAHAGQIIVVRPHLSPPAGHKEARCPRDCHKAEVPSEEMSSRRHAATLANESGGLGPSVPHIARSKENAAPACVAKNWPRPVPKFYL